MGMSPYLRRLRGVVGSERLLIPSVAGLVRDEDSRILLVQSRDDQRWSTPGGAVELDESPADAVVRELWEETSLFVRPTRIFAVYGGPEFIVRYPNGDETQYVSTMFECEVVSGELRVDDDEVQDARFFSLGVTAALRVSPWMTRVMSRLYSPATETW